MWSNPSLHPAGAACRAAHHFGSTGVLSYVPFLLRNHQSIRPYALVPLQPWSAAERRCRHGRMEEWLYRDLESGNFRRSFSPEIADKLAAFYSIPVKDLLDDYALFFHRGGGAFLRRYREAKGWNRQQLADHAKVGRTSIRCWETGQKTISQKCFHLLVENLGSDFLSMLRM